MDYLHSEFAIAHADGTLHKVRVSIPMNGLDLGDALRGMADQALAKFQALGAAPPVPVFVPTEAEKLTEELEVPETKADAG
jgi:hypothetical protein